MGTTLRRFSVDINWGRAFLALALIVGFGMLMMEPAFASGGGAFTTVQNKLTTQTGNAIGVARTVLLTGAVLSLIVGLAPMLWGQVKVKWIVTALVACVLFGISALMVTAFSGSSVEGKGQMTGQE